MRSAIILFVILFSSGALAQEVVTASSEDIQEFDRILAKAKANGHANFQPPSVQRNVQNVHIEGGQRMAPAQFVPSTQQRRAPPPPPPAPRR